jgi:hypothetical protein
MAKTRGIWYLTMLYGASLKYLLLAHTSIRIEGGRQAWRGPDVSLHFNGIWYPGGVVKGLTLIRDTPTSGTQDVVSSS